MYNKSLAVKILKQLISIEYLKNLLADFISALTREDDYRQILENTRCS